MKAAQSRNPLRRQAARTRRFVQRHPSVRRGGRLIYALVAGFLFVVMCVLIYKTYNNPRLLQGCTDTAHALPDKTLLFSAFGALLVGRISGYFRYDERWSRLDKQEADASKALGIKAFAFFAGACGIALIYEAFGLAYASAPPIPTPEPITSYVRCAVVIDKTQWHGAWLSYLVICSVCVLLGHWLWAWHPSEDLEA